MKIDVFDYDIEEYVRSGYVIDIEGRASIYFRDGEPEDNGLNRNFSGVYSIPDLIRAAHESGTKGEPLCICEHHHHPDDPDDCAFCLSS